jgi:cytochrome c oxidase subunit 2
MWYKWNTLGFIALVIFVFFIADADCDAPEAWQAGMQDPATPVMEGIIHFHNYLMFYMVAIGIFVGWLLYRIIVLYNKDANPTPILFTHSTVLEIVWTLVPAVILLVIAMPSFTLLYSMEEIIDPSLTLKVVGHQWYWEYEYSDFVDSVGENFAMDSYMVAQDDLTPGALRLLEVDNRVTLPVKTHLRVLVTSADVLHSWAVPSFGVKVDACPGRLNQVSIFIDRPGVFYGQCSEICGVGHGFMPIVVEAI